MHDTAIYLGPSLGLVEAEAILKARYLPPIQRGDLALLPEEIRTVGIIDGEFYQSLSVSSKEIVALLDRGVKVYGASSMGALRAAETYSLGMVGIGEVFAMFRDGVLDGDDEVALMYEAETYKKLSEPLVNLRNALKMAADGNVIDVAERDRLISRMKACYFPYRSYKALQSLCPRLEDFFRKAVLPDLKSSDARQLLLTIRESHHPEHTMSSVEASSQ
jgi:hypothetical protein